MCLLNTMSPSTAIIVISLVLFATGMCGSNMSGLIVVIHYPLSFHLWLLRYQVKGLGTRKKHAKNESPTSNR